MNATIITIGDELLIGQIINTNSGWLAAELTALGFSVENHVSISDKADSIKKTLDYYLPDNDLLILTGGLGPTNDDITKKVLADFFNSDLIYSDEVFADVESFIRSQGATINRLHRDQAMVPEKAGILRNRCGTAAGMLFERDGKAVISLPGVPREMKAIFNDYVKTALNDFFSLPQIVYRTVMLTGISESLLAGRLEKWESDLQEDIKVAYLPSPGLIRLRLGIKGDDKQVLSSRLEKEIEKLHRIVPDHIYGYDGETLESVTGRMIAERGGFLAAAESCTGGTIAGRVTAIPGCSAWFKGGVVAYSNEIKASVLGVKLKTLREYGAVSGETIEEMVRGAMKIFGTEYAVATSGIAGPDGGTAEKPVGTVWIAAAGPDFLIKKKFIFGQDRGINIMRSSHAAFNMLREALLEHS